MRKIPDGLDRCVIEFDRALRTLAGVRARGFDAPDAGIDESELSQLERRHAAALMRVNHSGEVCAQALYSGQALSSRDTDVRTVLEASAAEESRHLAWTASRVDQLGGRLSLLNPALYAGSFAIGAISGALGDRWNLGFLAETERQVEAHLDGHLERLPEADLKSRAVVGQMMEDEARHAVTAMEHGGRELPRPVKQIMRLTARLMTFATYRI